MPQKPKLKITHQQRDFNFQESNIVTKFHARQYQNQPINFLPQQP